MIPTTIHQMKKQLHTKKLCKHKKRKNKQKKKQLKHKLIVKREEEEAKSEHSVKY